MCRGRKTKVVLIAFYENNLFEERFTFEPKCFRVYRFVTLPKKDKFIDLWDFQLAAE